MQSSSSTGSMPTARIRQPYALTPRSPARLRGAGAAAFAMLPGSSCIERLHAGGECHDVFLGDRRRRAPPTSPAICPSRITRTRSQMPMISGSSEEITITPMPPWRARR